MKKTTAILAALAVMVAAPAMGQVSATKQTTIETRTSTDGSVHSSETNSTTVNGATRTTVETEKVYTTRLNNAYRAAGLADAEIERLRAIDIEAQAALRANDAARVKTYYEQQARILNPTQVEKVRVYLKENPAPATHAVRTTYEVVPTGGAGVSINTPLGSVGVGTPQGSAVIERKEVVPVQ